MTSNSSDLCSQSTLNRRKSLQLPPRPVDVPIPPTLLQSPYLTSPGSIFQRSLSAPHFPSEEDEQWLQDTVPLAPSPTTVKKSRLSDSYTPSSQSTASGKSSQNSARSSVRPQSTAPRQVPPSPPLVRGRRSLHLAPEIWQAQPRVRSAPCLAEAEFFYRA